MTDNQTEEEETFQFEIGKAYIKEHAGVESPSGTLHCFSSGSVCHTAEPLTDTSDGFKAILQDIITRLDDLTCGESLSLKTMRKLEKACEELKELEDELFPVD